MVDNRSGLKPLRYAFALQGVGGLTKAGWPIQAVLWLEWDASCEPIKTSFGLSGIVAVAGKAHWWEPPHSCGGARLSSRAARLGLNSPPALAAGFSASSLGFVRVWEARRLGGPFKPSFGLSGIVAVAGKSATVGAPAFIRGSSAFKPSGSPGTYSPPALAAGFSASSLARTYPTYQQLVSSALQQLLRASVQALTARYQKQIRNDNRRLKKRLSTANSERDILLADDFGRGGFSAAVP